MKKQWMSLGEVALFYSLVHFVIWGSTLWRPPILLTAILMIGLCIVSNRVHGDTLEKIGLANNNFWPTAKFVLPIAMVLILPLILLGWGKGGREGWNFWFAVLGYPFWGLAQEYALLGFVANRLQDIWPKKESMLPWVNGFLFSLVHLPNPVLMLVTFVAGTAFTWVFLKKRHIVPLALVHAAFGVAFSFAFSHIKGIMSVGPAYLSRIGNIP